MTSHLKFRYATCESDIYLHELNWASWVLRTVLGNQGTVAQRHNLTQNWVFPDLAVHHQALRRDEYKELIKSQF